MTPAVAAMLVTVMLALAFAVAARTRVRPIRASRAPPPERRIRRHRDAIEFFHPADLLALHAPHPECEGLFPLARDTRGNLYVVDPRQADPAVVRIDPRANERQVVCRSLSEFLGR